MDLIWQIILLSFIGKIWNELDDADLKFGWYTFVNIKKIAV